MSKEIRLTKNTRSSKRFILEIAKHDKLSILNFETIEMAGEELFEKSIPNANLRFNVKVSRFEIITSWKKVYG